MENCDKLSNSRIFENSCFILISNDLCTARVEVMKKTSNVDIPQIPPAIRKRGANLKLFLNFGILILNDWD